MDHTSFGCPSQDTFTDTHLHLQRAKSGDHDSYQELLARFRPGLETIVALEIKRTNGAPLRSKLAANAEDLLQGTVKKGFEKLNEIDYLGPGSVMAYFAQILRRRIHNFREFWRADVRDVGREVEMGPRDTTTTSAASGHAAPGDGPRTTFQISEQRQRVADALARLDTRHRDLLVLRFFGGASWAEVATEFGLPSAAAARMECNNKALPAFALALSRPRPPNA